MEGADTMLSGGYIDFRLWRMTNQHGTLGRDFQPSVFFNTLRPTDDRQSVRRIDLSRVRLNPGMVLGLYLRPYMVLNHLQMFLMDIR